MLQGHKELLRTVLGLTSEQAARLLPRKPAPLLRPGVVEGLQQALDQQLEWLESQGASREQAAQVLLVSPALLFAPGGVEGLQQKVERLCSLLGLTGKEVIELLLAKPRVCPGVLEGIQQKVERLCSALGMTSEQVIGWALGEQPWPAVACGRA